MKCTRNSKQLAPRPVRKHGLSRSHVALVNANSIENISNANICSWREVLFTRDGAEACRDDDVMKVQLKRKRRNHYANARNIVANTQCYLPL